ncbi:MFS transporter [Nocardioides sp. WG-D5]
MTRTVPSTAVFAGVAAVFASFFLAAGAPIPLLSLRQQEWGFSASTYTLAFSVYALAMLGAVLVGGSLSDHVGRRPVLLGALVGELAAMVLFLVADDIAWIMVARVVQGVATGFATSAFSAALIEHAPSHLKQFGTSFAGTASAGGLGVGALLTGAAVQFASDANSLVFGVLAVVMVVGFGIVAFADETGVTRPGAVRSLNPRISLPAPVRREFLGGLPVHAAGWMLAAFFMALAPAVVRIQFGLSGGLVAGFTAFVAPFSAAVGTLAFGRVVPRRNTLIGVSLVLTGMTAVMVGVTVGWLGLVWLGGIVGGIGFGASFAGHLRLLGPYVEPHQRAGVFAGVYTVAYLSFGVPAIVAGQLAIRVGLLGTVEGYAVVVLATAVVAFVVQTSFARRDRESVTRLLGEAVPEAAAEAATASMRGAS